MAELLRDANITIVAHAWGSDNGRPQCSCGVRHIGNCLSCKFVTQVIFSKQDFVDTFENIRLKFENSQQFWSGETEQDFHVKSTFWLNKFTET